jgi:nitroreductase
MVENSNVKNRLADEAMLGVGNQYRTRQCSALAVFLADLELGRRIQRVYHLEKQWGKRHPSYLSMFELTTAAMIGEGHLATLMKQIGASAISNITQQPMPQVEPVQTWSYKNCALAVQSYVLAATSHDLATSIMEGFDSNRLKRILRVPDRYGIPMVVATGYEYNDEESMENTPRLELDEVVFKNSFGIPFEFCESDKSEAS